jgi:hypothetical protein
LGRKRGAYTVSPWNTLASDNIHTLNGPNSTEIQPASLQLENKILEKPLDKEALGFSLSETPPIWVFLLSSLYLNKTQPFYSSLSMTFILQSHKTKFLATTTAHLRPENCNTSL